MMFPGQVYYPGQRMRSNCKERQGKDGETTSETSIEKQHTHNNNNNNNSLSHPIQAIMSLESAKSVLNILNAKVEAGDVEGGKAALAEMKVST